MQYLKADTVTEVLIGPVVAVGDGFTPVTTLTIAAADEAEIIKHGATTVTAITGTLAAITSADGYYALDLVTGDVDTEGRLTILINDDSLCLPVRHDFMVVNANVFDSLFAAATTDYLQVDNVQHLGTAFATPTVAGVPEVDLTHVAGATTNVSALATNVDAILTDTADMQPKLGTPAGASISADLLVIDNFVDGLETTIGSAGAGLTGVPWNAAWDAEVQSECNDALVALDLDHLTNNGTTVPAITAGTFIDQIMDDGTAVYDRTTDSLQAIKDHAVTIKTDTTAILIDTVEIGVAGAGLTSIAIGVGGIQATSFAAGAIDAASLAADATTELTAGIRIKKNTALANFMFLMVDSTDHITPKTGLTITATRSIDGAAFAACANAAAEVANGFYKINLANTDMNGDVIALKFTGGATADDRLLTIITTT